MGIVYDGQFQVFKVAGMGRFDNNGYVIADPSTKEAYIIDAPDEMQRLLDEAKDFRVKAVLLTHTHPDHIAGYAELKSLTDLPVSVHPADQDRLPGGPDMLMEHGANLFIGGTRIQVLHTPGHTPGGVCFVVNDVLVSGDTLFPGGPGRTKSPDDFRQIVGSITEHLLALGNGTLVLPGHGVNTTIADARREYEVFASKEHPEDLHGHVIWLTS